MVVYKVQANEIVSKSRRIRRIKKMFVYQV